MSLPVPRLLGFLASQVAAATWGMAAQFSEQLHTFLPRCLCTRRGSRRAAEPWLLHSHPLTWPKTGINLEERAGSWSVGGQTQCTVCDGSEQSLVPGPVHFSQGFVQTGSLCRGFCLSQSFLWNSHMHCYFKMLACVMVNKYSHSVPVFYR